MTRHVVDLRAAGLVAAVAIVAALAACSQGDSGPAITCARVDGVWDMTFDFGNGLVGQQTWTITQDGCDLTLSGDPPFPSTPLLGDGATPGYAYDGALSASWINTWDACRISSHLEATVAGDTLAGTITWARNAHGAGYCSAAIGQIPTSGTR